MNAEGQAAPVSRTKILAWICLVGLFLIFPAALLFMALLSSDSQQDMGEALPVIKLQYITIDRQGGIEGVCCIGEEIETVLRNLGRPDAALRNPVSEMFYEDVYRYEDYGLEIRCMWIKKVTSLRIDFNEQSMNRIRFFDEQALAFPLKADRIISLFGPPDRVRYGPRPNREPKRWKEFHYHLSEHELIFHTIEQSEDEIGWLYVRRSM